MNFIDSKNCICYHFTPKECIMAQSFATYHMYDGGRKQALL